MSFGSSDVAVSSDDRSSTFSHDETTTVVTGAGAEPVQITPSSAETEVESRPVAASWDVPADPSPQPRETQSYWGLSPRDCLLLAGLAVLGLGLSVWHWGQLSGWGLEPVEIDRLPERVYDYRIDINQATRVEWMQLPGVGPALSERIIEYRDEHGPFQSVEQLDKIKGIGPKTVQKLRPWLFVSEAEKPKAVPGNDR